MRQQSGGINGGAGNVGTFVSRLAPHLLESVHRSRPSVATFHTYQRNAETVEEADVPQ